jgi:8-oxo-dGTP diphosphatase
MLIDHDYPVRQVRLHVHTACSFNGTVEGLEGQALKWVDIADLDELDFLAGNQVILDKIKSLN